MNQIEPAHDVSLFSGISTYWHSISEDPLKYINRGLFGVLAAHSISRFVMENDGILAMNVSSILMLEALIHASSLSCFEWKRNNVKDLSLLGISFILSGSLAVSHHLLSNQSLALITDLAVLAIQNSLVSSTIVEQNDTPELDKYVDVVMLPENLRECETIPDIISEYPTFQENICPIGGVPIRDPVKDPYDGKMYERKYIVRALANDPRSPCTREPLYAEDLIECAEEKSVIDRALAHISRVFSRLQ